VVKVFISKLLALLLACQKSVFILHVLGLFLLVEHYIFPVACQSFHHQTNKTSFDKLSTVEKIKLFQY
jgi:hypothetical protein